MWNQIKNINWGCHGIPERCLIVKGKRMSICARCFGSNIGHIIAIILFIAGFLPPWYYSLIFMGLLLIDWSLQAFLKIMSNNTRRVITGIIGGIGVGSLIWSMVLFVIIFIKNLF
jgi:uncharacterized membrane protein